MARLDIGQTTVTDLNNGVKDYSVDAGQIDQDGSNDEVFWDFPDASEHLGHYQNHPEMKSALRALGLYITGQGWTSSPRQAVRLRAMKGWGNDTFQSICMQMVIESKVFGDSFAEIIKSKDGRIINLKKLYPGDMRIVVNSQGLIKRYEQRSNDSKSEAKKFSTDKILHFSNDRMANEIHGTSVTESLKFIIEAKNEALQDERKIRHRELALGIIYYDTENASKITSVNKQVKDAINKGEMLGLPKDVAKIENNPNAPRDRIQWLQYLDNLFYQILGVPKAIATSEGFSEAGAKVGIFTFEPVYNAEQRKLEADLWNQAAIKVSFQPAPSLSGNMQDNETKAGNDIQPSDTQLKATRTE